MGPQRRYASYQRFGGRGAQWQKPGIVGRAQYYWSNYRTLIIGTGAAGGGFYVYNLEDVPVTGRRRFNFVSPDAEKQIGANEYNQVLREFQGNILPEDHPYTRMVAKVVQRLLPSTGGLAGEEWVVHVVDDPKTKNAFVIPGGKVFIFTGMLPVCEDEDGVAAVLAHEIAHNVAHHAAEKVSEAFVLGLLAFAAWIFFDIAGGNTNFILSLLMKLPNSRKMETEADHIGLLMMAESCFDPEAAVKLWRRMAESGNHAPPQFISTHPSDRTRIETLGELLPAAKQRYEASECGLTRNFTDEFRRAFHGPSGRPGGAHPDMRTQTATDEDPFW